MTRTIMFRNFQQIQVLSIDMFSKTANMTFFNDDGTQMRHSHFVDNIEKVLEWIFSDDEDVTVMSDIVVVG